jgi:hypothetical protein
MVCVLGFFVRFLSETAIIVLKEFVIIAFGPSSFHVLYYNVYDRRLFLAIY